MNNSKKALAVQTIFFIMMSLIMIWIIIFGIQKVSSLQDTISQDEQIKIQKKIEDTFAQCSDPINEGTQKTISLRGEKFNSICYNGHLADGVSSRTDPIYVDFKSELETLSNSGDNFVLIQTSFSSGNLVEYNILASFEIEDLGYSEGICWFDLENQYNQDVKIKCD